MAGNKKGNRVGNMIGNTVGNKPIAEQIKADYAAGLSYKQLAQKYRKSLRDLSTILKGKDESESMGSEEVETEETQPIADGLPLFELNEEQTRSLYGLAHLGEVEAEVAIDELLGIYKWMILEKFSIKDFNQIKEMLEIAKEKKWDCADFVNHVTTHHNTLYELDKLKENASCELDKLREECSELERTKAYYKNTIDELKGSIDKLKARTTVLALCPYCEKVITLNAKYILDMKNQFDLAWLKKLQNNQ